MLNTLKTTIFLTLLTLPMIFVGSAIRGKNCMFFGFAMVFTMNFFSCWFSNKTVLKIFNAPEATSAYSPM